MLIRQRQAEPARQVFLATVGEPEMPRKRRVSKERAIRITPEAIQAFRDGDEERLRKALRMHYWEISPLEEEAFPDAPPAYAAELRKASQPQAQALRRELMQATGGFAPPPPQIRGEEDEEDCE